MSYQAKYFQPAEYMCRCGCGRANVRPFFLERLDALRELCGFPIILSSGFRCPEYNKAVGGGEFSGHPEGLAADIQCSHDRAWSILNNGMRVGFAGVGVKQHGPINERFIHFDDCPSMSQRPRPTVWTYS